MRSPFNTHCEIFAGPGTSTPGASRGVFPCRLVVEDGIHSQQLDPGQPWIPAYLTIQDYRPKGMFVPPKYSVDSIYADRVAVPATGPVNYMVFYTDFIVWKQQKKYYRAYLIEIPNPDLGFGGVVIDGLAVVHPPAVVTLGGVACGGTGQPVLFTLQGGVELGGMAIVIPSKPFVTDGGMLIGGIAIAIPGGAVKPIGGVLLGGAAAVIPSKPFTSVGGVLIGGDATILPPGKAGAIGGILLGGVAEVIPGSSFVTFGGVLIGGQGSYSTNVVSGSVLSTSCDVPTGFIRVGVDTVSSLVSGDTVLVSGCTVTPAANGTWTALFVQGAPFNTFVLGGNPCGGYPYGPEFSAIWTKL